MNSEDASADAGEEVDRRQLRRAQTRFRAIGAARLERLKNMLAERQRPFVELLPLLLHLNHPALPGYISPQTPCGVSGYRPEAATHALARRLWRSYGSHPGEAAAEDVLAIYLMGSSGTLGHTDSSDLDIWICYAAELAPAALALLQRKAELIGAWGNSLGLETHVFLMSDRKFRQGEREPLTGENCGTAQHHLLLDEFYRTGILVAGRMPGWWLVPPGDEPRAEQWLQSLLAKRHIAGSQLLDFGGLDTVPANEFVGAGVWQLYKAIDSPYKSILKLLLFEIYAGEFPAAAPLSAGFKRAIYAGVTDIDELDPYLMVYRRIEEYLQRTAQHERLELARRCLYYKAGSRLSQPRGTDASWQQHLMQRLTQDWGWDHAKLALLDSRPRWNIAEVAIERNALVKELVQGYRFLAEFSRRAETVSSIDTDELGVLGRKLYAAYERRAGKIENLRTGFSGPVAEPELSLCARRDAAGEALWGVYQGLVRPRSNPQGRLLRQAACLTELLGWCVLNGVIDTSTRIALREAEDGLRQAELETMLRGIRELLHGSASPGVDEQAFAQQARPVRELVLVNVAAEPGAAGHDAGLQLVSSRSDALAFSAMRENLVLNLETLTVNSWGEVVATRYTGEDGLLRCVRELSSVATASAPTLRVLCAGTRHAASIEARIGALLRDIGACFARHGREGTARYVLATGNRLHLIEQDQDRMVMRCAANEDALFALLAAPRTLWGSLTVDTHALRETPLPLVATSLEPGRIGVFCEMQQAGIRIILADERGSLLRWTISGARKESALAALAQFLQSVRYRQIGQGVADVPTVQFYELTRKARQPDWSARRIADPAPLGSAAALHIQALTDHDGIWTVYCDGIAFSQRELGEDFAPTLSAHIRSLRASRGSYPVYITDLDLSALDAAPARAVQTVLYLSRKCALEQGLNAAIAD